MAQKQRSYGKHEQGSAIRRVQEKRSERTEHDSEVAPARRTVELSNEAGTFLVGLDELLGAFGAKACVKA